MDEFIDLSFLPDGENVALKHIYQYDRGRKLRIYKAKDVTSMQVHYSIEGMSKAILNTPTLNGDVWTSPIPNALIMQSTAIQVYIYVVLQNSAQTVMHVTIPIKKRPKPEGFEYTEEELRGLEYVMQQLDSAIKVVENLNKITDQASKTAAANALAASNAAENAVNATEAANKATIDATTAAKTAVKTVNSKAPDNNGNVNIEVGNPDVITTMKQDDFNALTSAEIVQMHQDGVRTILVEDNGNHILSWDDVSNRPAMNLLDNSNFKDLIAQGGFFIKHGVGEDAETYAADRWVSNGAKVKSTDADGATLSADGQDHQIYQNVKTVIGKSYTFAVKIVSASGATRISTTAFDSGGEEISGSSKSVDGTTGILILQFTAKANVSRVVIYPGVQDGGGTAKVEWAALYEGNYTSETIPTYTPKGYLAELAECQRYYYRVIGNDAYHLRFDGWYSNSSIRFMLDTNVPMIPSRPSVIVEDITGIEARTTGGTSKKSWSSVSCLARMGNHLLLSLNNDTTPFDNYSPVMISIPNAAGLAFSADLL